MWARKLSITASRRVGPNFCRRSLGALACSNHQYDGKFSPLWTIAPLALCGAMVTSNIALCDQSLGEDGSLDIDSLPVFSAEEVAKNNGKNGKVWMTYGGVVYDVTEFINNHPGKE